MPRVPFFLALLIFTTNLFAQDNYQSFLITPALTKNANAVVRNEVVEIHIEAIDKMRILTRRVVTVLNKNGDEYGFAYDSYDKNTKIKKQAAFIQNQAGEQIRKFKSKDFDDRSLVGSNDLYNDNRLSYLDYTPQEYPYTIIYESEVETSYTIFVRDWKPVSGYHLSVERAQYTLKNPAGIPLRFQERNLSGLNVERNNTTVEIDYILEDFAAYKHEYLGPSFENFAPQVRVALNNFSLVGVQGSGSSWHELGKWQYENLLKGRDALPPSTIQKIERLTAEADNDVEKARIIYDYVQNNTRYISVQLGIGGWEPMPATEVDRLQYGDCKALTNYTKALLDSQNIPSYYAVVYGGRQKKHIDAEFASMQGNHVILNIPQEEGDIWLECTSQTNPFDYLGNFTDDRNVLLIKPEGGEIIRTKAYSLSENLQETHSVIRLDEAGGFTVDLVRKSTGVPYREVYTLKREREKDQVLYYKNLWGHLKNMDLQKLQFGDDRINKEFTEEISFKAEKFVSRAGKHLLLPLNFTYTPTYRVPRTEERTLPLHISRARSYKDRFEYVLPEGFHAEAIPEDVRLESRFGEYTLSIAAKEKEGQNVLEVERYYAINEGEWPAGSYNEFRDFMNKINSFNGIKAVIALSN